jgi:hypothetical protein
MLVGLAERPDPADPAIEALTLEPQRSTLVRVFTAAQAAGTSQRGPIFGVSGTPTVTGSSAQTVTCLDQTFTRVYERSGKARPGSSGGRTPFLVRLRRDAGSWKVFSSSSRPGTCSVPR